MVLRSKKLTGVLFPKGYLKYVRFAGHLIVSKLLSYTLFCFFFTTQGENKLVSLCIDNENKGAIV